MAVAVAEGRRERRKRELRARIYECARELFLSQGFEATTVAQIAEAADVAQGTFFNHFASKQALLQEITLEVSDHLEGMVTRQLRREVPAPERILGFAVSVATDIGEARGLARDVLLELLSSSARPGEAYPYLARAHGPFCELIRQGQARGEIRDDLDADFLSEIVLGSLNVAVTHWVVDVEYPLEARLRQTVAFVNQAIEPRSARTRD
jgi:AcrR family transcriptional regulator